MSYALEIVHPGSVATLRGKRIHQTSFWKPCYSIVTGLSLQLSFKEKFKIAIHAINWLCELPRLCIHYVAVTDYLFIYYYYYFFLKAIRHLHWILLYTNSVELSTWFLSSRLPCSHPLLVHSIIQMACQVVAAHPNKKFGLHRFSHFDQWSGRFFGIIGWDPKP